MSVNYEGIDFRMPDYSAVFRQRLDFLNNIRANLSRIPALKTYYRDHIADFINDWGVTFDPRNADLNLPGLIPFVLFPKQREWIEWVIKHRTDRRRGITEKSRDGGLTWLAISMSCALCIFRPGMVVGFGSRKALYVDEIGNPRAILEKGRLFMRNLPTEFRGGWDAYKNSNFMRLTFPKTGAIISGESGDNIGRGDRTSIYFVDEAARIEHPQLAESALSNTTNCRIDISTPNGMGNAFAQKRFEGKLDVFTFHWRDDPRKNDEWYQRQCEEFDPVTVAAELDINYSASVEGILIPSAWVQAAINAHRVLGIAPTGARRAEMTCKIGLMLTTG
jgi:phage terminase large subunit